MKSVALQDLTPMVVYFYIKIGLSIFFILQMNNLFGVPPDTESHIVSFIRRFTLAPLSHGFPQPKSIAINPLVVIEEIVALIVISPCGVIILIFSPSLTERLFASSG